MRKLVLSIFAGFCALIMVSCAGEATPANEAETYFENIKSNDWKAVIDQLYFKNEVTDEQKEGLVSMIEEKAQKSIEKDGTIESYELVSETIDESGEKAKVEYLIKYSTGKEKNKTVKLVKIDGKWMIDSGK